MADPLCHCGRHLHYTRPATRRQVQELIDKFGEFIDVVGHDGRRWRVQRHYIALHGLRNVDLPSLGFEEITDDA